MVERNLLFGWVDYLAFGLTLSASALIGVFFACRGVNSTSEYLMGGKQMKILPVAISISARYSDVLNACHFKQTDIN